MFGFLNIDKPAGLTSRDVVNRVQRLVRPEKVGHAGTLDPLATGVLVVAIGWATRLTEFVQRLPKRYVGTFLLGCHSDTEDTEGTVVEISDPPRPSRAEILAALPNFVGEIQQVPPAYSALKVQGRRAYALARAGQSVELAPRLIRIYELSLLDYAYPALKLEIECGSGTYVRSLGRDLAESLGTAAVMSALRRTAIGPFRIEAACDVGELTGRNLSERLLPATWALADRPRLVLSPAEVTRVRQGQSIPNRAPSAVAVAEPEVVALDPVEQLVGLLRVDGELLRPVRIAPVTPP